MGTITLNGPVALKAGISTAHSSRPPFQREGRDDRAHRQQGAIVLVVGSSSIGQLDG